MTVSTASTPLTYSGNGSTTAFPITWKYNAKSHVVAVLRSSSGAETTWVLGTNYTLTDPGDSGTLTATVAPAVGEKLVITLEPPNTQSSGLPIGGNFPSSAIESALDLAAQRDAKIEAITNLALHVPKTDTQTGSSLELPIDSARASKFLAFDANGKPIASVGTSSSIGPVTAFVNSLLDDTTASAFMSTILAALSAETAPAIDDELLLGDTSTGTVDYITLENLFKVINSFTVGGTPSPSADYVPFYSASAGAIRRGLVQNLAFASIGHQMIANATWAVTVGTNATTIALKTKAGSDPSSTDPVYVAFRNSTVTNGTYTVRSITSALSLTISAGSTLGFSASQTSRIYIVLIDNAGTIELAAWHPLSNVNGTLVSLDEARLYSTTAEGGAGAADSAATLYSTTARTNVPIRIGGYYEIQTGATPGNWGSSPTVIQIMGPGVRRTGEIIQTQRTEQTTLGTLGTNVVPVDNTPPTTSEMNLAISQAITATSAINLLRTRAHLNVTHNAGARILVGIFKDSGTDALRIAANQMGTVNLPVALDCLYATQAASTSAITMKAYAAGTAAGTTFLNGDGGSAMYGSTLDSFIQVEEIFV